METNYIILKNGKKFECIFFAPLFSKGVVYMTVLGTTMAEIAENFTEENLSSIEYDYCDEGHGILENYTILESMVLDPIKGIRIGLKEQK